MMLWSELSKIIFVVVFLIKVINSDFGGIRTEGVDSDVMDVIQEENESYKVKRENHRKEANLAGDVIHGVVQGEPTPIFSTRV